jgi:hypothetical protein
MRRIGLIAVALFLIGIACGPDPNATLPGAPPYVSAGGAPTSAGGKTGAGGATGAGGGVNPFSGGSTGSTGGATYGTGGYVTTGGTTGIGYGGATGAGGTTTASTGALTSYNFGTGAEPCSPPKDVSGGQSGNLGLGAVCLRTADDFSSWNCSSMDDRTVKINGTPVKCGDAPPAKIGSFYYFDVSAGPTAWASFSWFCNVQGCGGAHPIPSCGHYPAWVSGGSAAPCSDTTSPSDAAASTPGVDSGS